MKSAMSEAFRIWLYGVVLGALAAAFLPQGAGAKVDAALYVLGGPAEVTSLAWIFLKNSLASLCIIFLGTLLCVLELLIYRGVSPDTYAFLERLTDPLYALLDRFEPEYRELKPFFRSCHFYLNFVPAFAMLVNGLVLGFYLERASVHEALALLPHGLLELPAMLGSAALAFYTAERVEEPMLSADSGLFVAEMRKSVSDGGFALAVLLIQAALLAAAYLEAL